MMFSFNMVDYPMSFLSLGPLLHAQKLEGGMNKQLCGGEQAMWWVACSILVSAPVPLGLYEDLVGVGPWGLRV